MTKRRVDVIEKVEQNTYRVTATDGTTHDFTTKEMVVMAMDACRLAGRPATPEDPHPATVIAKVLGLTRRRVEQIIKAHYKEQQT